ncbi:MAG: 30S ribosomal protein S17e [Candidatus Woesearchaeota archaeon]
MGRIKTQRVKSATLDLFQRHQEEVTTDFVKNKELAGKHAQIGSKKIRNVVAGYLTRLKRAE